MQSVLLQAQGIQLKDLAHAVEEDCKRQTEFEKKKRFQEALIHTPVYTQSEEGKNKSKLKVST